MHNKKEEQENRLLWENRTWDSSNLDDSGGSKEKNKDKPMDSSINNPIRVKNEEEMIGKKKGKRGISNGKGSKRSSKEGKGCGESDHEIHIWTERERRKKMRNMFSNLHALLPKLPPKADKSTIVDEAVNYIKSLQQTLESLQKQKLEKIKGISSLGYDSPLINPQNLSESREAYLAEQGSSNSALITSTKPSNISSDLKYPVLFQTWTSPNVVLNICGDEAQISICSPKKPGLFTSICYVLQKHNIEVLSAHVSSDYNRSLYMIQAYYESGTSDQFGEALIPLEELYKQVVSEIMCWVSS